MLLQNMVEANGKTVRENNLDRGHVIPLDALVEIEGTEHHGVRAFVVYYHRDCDGTPLYGLSMTKGIRPNQADHFNLNSMLKIETGFSDDCLKVVE